MGQARRVGRAARQTSFSGAGQRKARANQSPNPAYRAYSDKLTQESCVSFSLLHYSTTPEQRARAVRRLAAYERDARELGSQR